VSETQSFLGVGFNSSRPGAGYIGRGCFQRPNNLPKTNMKKQLLGYLLFCALLTWSSVALAQKTYVLGIGGGAAIPVGKLSDTQKTGYNVMAALAVGVPDLPLGVRIDVMYNNLSHRNATTPSGTASSDLRVKAVAGNLVFAFSGNGAKAYILAGGGLYNSKADVAGAKSQNNFGVNAGLGATVGFGPFATFLESRYHSVSRSEAKGGVFQFVPITFGVMF
jgi:Outer membrane protein beta-barrel domain